MIKRAVFKFVLGVLLALVVDRALLRRRQAAEKRRAERRPNALVGRLLDAVNSRLERDKARGPSAPSDDR
jgi:hypothetical protein